MIAGLEVRCSKQVRRHIFFPTDRRANLILPQIVELESKLKIAEERAETADKERVDALVEAEQVLGRQFAVPLSVLRRAVIPGTNHADAATFKHSSHAPK